MYRMLLLANAISPIELINTSTRLCSFLLACIEWMALGTDFNVDILLGRTCHKCVTAVTRYGCLIVIWMDSFFHLFHLSHHLRISNKHLLVYIAINSFLSIAYTKQICKLFF